MLNIPEEIKNLFKTDGVRKNIRIHFPNGEREDITNDNILKDSFSFSERLCSRDSLKFGLCEANTLEFECFDVGNIKGFEIEASVELILDEPISITKKQQNYVYDDLRIDWTSGYVISFETKTSGVLSWNYLTTDASSFSPLCITSSNEEEEPIYTGGNFKEIHFENVTYLILSSFAPGYDIYLSSVRFTHDVQEYQEVIEGSYSIPYGLFVVDSCNKQTDYYNRKIVAYTKEIEWDKIPNPIERAKIDGTIRNAYNTVYNFNVDAFVLSNIYNKDTNDNLLEQTDVPLASSYVFKEYEYLSTETINNPYNTTWVNNIDTYYASEACKSVVYGNGRFVTIANLHDRSAYSLDGGLTWSFMNGLKEKLNYINSDGKNGSSEILYNSVAFGDGRFVCVGYYGESYYSIDGVNWVPMIGLESGINIESTVNISNAVSYYDVTYGDGRFVCVGSKGYSYYSTDGLNWLPMNGFPNITSNLGRMHLAYGDGRFVFIWGGGYTYHSIDGVNWIKGDTIISGAECVIYAENHFVSIVGSTVYISYDGIYWEQFGTYDLLDGITAICYENNRYVCVGDDGASYYSVDLQNWYALKGLPATNGDYRSGYNSIAYGDGYFVCVGDLGARASLNDKNNSTNKYVCNIAIDGMYYTPASNADANKLYKIEFDECENFEEIKRRLFEILTEYIGNVNEIRNNLKGPATCQELCDIIKNGVFKTRTAITSSTYDNVYIPLNGHNYIYPYLNLNNSEIAKFYTSTNMMDKTFIMVPYYMTVTVSKKLPTGGKTTFDTVEVISEMMDIRPFYNILLTSMTNLSTLTLSVNRKSIGGGLYTMDQSKMFDMKSLVEGFAECRGLFGRYNRYGVFELFKINQNFGLYPAENLYPMDELFARSSNVGLVTRGCYSNAVYDDEATKPYNKVSVVFVNTNSAEAYLEKEVNHIFLNNKTEKYQEYLLDDNFLIRNCKFTNDQINTILERVSDSLKFISYIPAEVESVGLPYIETGDVIRVLTHDGGFETIILSRDISGDQLLTDNYQSRG